MKWTTYLLFVASVAMANPSEDRTQKSFSLFSIVQFPNDQCQTNMADMLGICITAEECDAQEGGSAAGNCASGFGVCCFTMISDPATAITNNMTYIQNDGFPTGVGATGTVAAVNRAYSIQGGTDISQIRLDFVTTVLTAPAAGACASDAITVTSPSTTRMGFENLCGVLSGQHIYVENDGAAVNAVLNINTNNVALAGGRSWKILVRMLEKGSPSLAPEGCLQYFTGTSGRVTSFNHVVNNAPGMMLLNLAYTSCIRSESGMNCIRYRQSRDTTAPDAFNLDALGTAGRLDASCDRRYLIIQGVEDTSGTGISGDRFCGTLLNSENAQTNAGPVISTMKPFQIGVVSNAANPAVASTLFDLIYNQEAC
jgi:hypothetical protein